MEAAIYREGKLWGSEREYVAFVARRRLARAARRGAEESELLRLWGEAARAGNSDEMLEACIPVRTYEALERTLERLEAMVAADSGWWENPDLDRELAALWEKTDPLADAV